MANGGLAAFMLNGIVPIIHAAVNNDYFYP